MNTTEKRIIESIFRGNRTVREIATDLTANLDGTRSWLIDMQSQGLLTVVRFPDRTLRYSLTQKAESTLDPTSFAHSHSRPRTSLFDQPTYQSHMRPPARQGALDAFSLPSLGIS